MQHLQLLLALSMYISTVLHVFSGCIGLFLCLLHVCMYVRIIMHDYSLQTWVHSISHGPNGRPLLANYQNSEVSIAILNTCTYTCMYSFKEVLPYINAYIRTCSLQSCSAICLHTYIALYM